MRMPRSIFTVYTFARINTRRFFRDKLSIFFGVLFPLIFLFVFGGIFGGNDNASFRVALINNSDSQFASQFVEQLESDESFNINQSYSDLDAAREEMVHSQIDAAIILPEDFGVVDPEKRLPTGEAEVYYTQNNAQAGQTLVAVLDGVFKGYNTSLTELDMPFTVAGEQINDRSLTQFDYTFAGLLGFALLGVGIFGPVNVFPELKKQGILRRLSTTPLRVWQYFSSIVLSQAVVGLVSVGVMFATALAVFDLEVVGNVALLIGYVVFSIVMILGIGLAIGGWASNERQAAPLSNIVVFPMMFLSGTFFPRFLMPDWLQNLSDFLPLTPVIDGLRFIINEGYSIAELAPQLGLMAAWTIVIYFIAFRVFRWE